MTRFRPAVRLQLLILCALCFLANYTIPAFAQTGFISAAGRRDMVYDVNRQTVYITRTVFDANYPYGIRESEVVRYKFGTGLLAPIRFLDSAGNPTGNLIGIDISPDGNFLAVADGTNAAGQCWFWLVDLRTDSIQKVTFPLDFGESGTFTVAFTNDNALLISSRFAGSGWVPLRRYNLTTGTSAVVHTVRQDSMLCPSADGNVIAVAESNSSDGPVGRFRVLDGNYLERSGYADGTAWFNYEIGVNRNATQYAVPTYNGAYIYDANMVKTGARIGNYAADHPIGVVYNPFSDIVYFAWATTTQVRAHRTSDFAVVNTWDMQTMFDSPGNHAFGEGRLRIAKDTSYLFCTVDNGVRYVLLGNPRPVANFQTVRTSEDTPASFAVSGLNPGGASLRYELLSQPARGTLTGSLPNVTYTPAADFNGTDNFTFRVWNSVAASSPATVNLTVASVNDAPSFTKGADQTVNQGSGAQTVPNWATNISPGPPDEGVQTVQFLVSNNNPNLFAVAPGISPTGTLTFTPSSTAVGTATVSVRLKDSGGTANGGVDTSVEQTFTITVRSTNQAPTANNDTASTAEDTPVDVDVVANDTDPEGDPLTITSTTQGANGSTAIVNGKVRYTPNPNYNRSDSFTYTINDGNGNQVSGTVSVTVSPVNDPPTTNNQNVSTDEDASKSITLTGSDIDGDMLTFTVTTGPSHGSLSGSGANLTYTPAANYNGPDRFTFEVSDGNGGTATGTVNITVNPVNDAPSAANDAATTDEDNAVTVNVLSNDSDPDSDSLTVTAVTQPSNGTAAINNGSVVYTPNTNFNGSDSFTYTISDGNGGTATATVNVTVRAVNDAPTANGQDVTADEDTAKSITLTGSDPDGDPLSYVIVSAPAHGTLTGTGANRTYTPAPNYNGPDSFTFKVNDGTADSNVTTVTITVRAANDPPVAVNDAASVKKNGSVDIAVLANDSDPDGDALAITSVTLPANGTATIVGNTVRFVPKKGYNGVTSFRYTISDGRGGTATATVNVTVIK